MTKANEFDWDHAIALYKAHSPLQLVEEQRCRKGLHVLTPENVYLNRRTGHRRCRACAALTKQNKPPRQTPPKLVDWDHAAALYAGVTDASHPPAPTHTPTLTEIHLLTGRAALDAIDNQHTRDAASIGKAIIDAINKPLGKYLSEILGS